jgi:uncharacterized protein CbrC (UPF0167 family)
LPDVLRQIADVMPQFEGAALDSQLQVFDVFLGIVSASVRPQIAGLLADAANRARASHVRTRIRAAADSVALGGRAAEPSDHAKEMAAYQQSFAKSNPRAFELIPERALESLPTFKYHSDPIATGSIVESETECECCGRSRGFIYTGPVYAEGEYVECICPWCIADDTAHQNLGASFTDEASIGGCDARDSIELAIIEEVAHRTPGFNGWQQERWWTHCGDAAQFLGAAGKQELIALGPEAILAIRGSAGLEDWEDLFEALDREGSPTAYVFRCRKCGAFGGYHDCD